MGDFDDAAILLQRTVDVEPQNIDLQIQLAFAFLRSGQIDEAQMVLNSIPRICRQP